MCVVFVWYVLSYFVFVCCLVMLLMLCWSCVAAFCVYVCISCLVFVGCSCVLFACYSFRLCVALICLLLFVSVYCFAPGCFIRSFVVFDFDVFLRFCHLPIRVYLCGLSFICGLIHLFVFDWWVSISVLCLVLFVWADRFFLFLCVPICCCLYVLLVFVAAFVVESMCFICICCLCVGLLCCLLLFVIGLSRSFLFALFDYICFCCVCRCSFVFVSICFYVLICVWVAVTGCILCLLCLCF